MGSQVGNRDEISVVLRFCARTRFDEFAGDLINGFVTLDFAIIGMNCVGVANRVKSRGETNQRIKARDCIAASSMA